MDQVIIAEMDRNWVHVYTEENGQIWPAISANAKDLGWIKVDNLLLSFRCLANESGFTQKAMVLTDVGLLKTGEEKITQKDFYLGPELSKTSGNQARTFEIYFVFKRSANAVLLAKSDNLQESSEEVKGSVLGWMKNSNITFWDHRICLEPNWKQSAMDEYKDIPIAVFGTMDQARKYYQTGKPDSAIREKKLQGSRAPGEVKRSPLISYDKVNPSLKMIGTIGRLSSMDENQLAFLEHKLQTINEKIKNINILFVIDGTNSIKQFYTPVSQGIAAAMQSLINKESKNRIKFGAVIYRDFDNIKNVYAIEPLTDDHEKVLSFLNKVECSGDVKNAPALFYSLAKGIKEAGFEKEQSNFIILVGDVANKENDKGKVKIDQVIDLMVDYQCSMVAFQVNSKNESAYHQFSDDIGDMVFKTASSLTRGKNTGKDVISWKPIDKVSYAIQQKVIDSKEQESLIVAGRCYVAPMNGSFDFKSLQNAIVSTIEEYNSRVNEQKAFIDKILNLPTGDFTILVESMLRNRGFSDYEIGQIKIADAIRIEGWTADRVSGMKNPIYLPVVFLTNTELTDINRICSKLSSELTSSEKQVAFENALVQECKAITGDYSSSAEKQIEKMSLNDVWTILFGFPFHDPVLGKVILKDIPKRRGIKENQMEAFFAGFKERYKILKSISPKYPYCFKASEETYYWIDLEELP
jgi:hypothetical protein